MANEPSAQTVAFYKDQGGVVHLRGVATEGKYEEPIFTLPPGYRPSKSISIAVAGVGNAATTLAMNGPETSVPGTLYPYEGKSVSLDGVTFRAES